MSTLVDIDISSISIPRGKLRYILRDYFSEFNLPSRTTFGLWINEVNEIIPKIAPSGTLARQLKGVKEIPQHRSDQLTGSQIKLIILWFGIRLSVLQDYPGFENNHLRSMNHLIKEYVNHSTFTKMYDQKKLNIVLVKLANSEVSNPYLGKNLSGLFLTFYGIKVSTPYLYTLSRQNPELPTFAAKKEYTEGEVQMWVTFLQNRLVQSDHLFKKKDIEDL